MPSRSAASPFPPAALAALLAGALSSSIALAGAAPDQRSGRVNVSQRAPESPSIERFMKIRAPNMPRLAPGGALYVRDWPDGVNQLYRREPGAAPDSAMTRLTDFRDGVNGFALSPDGAKVILSNASGGSEQDDLSLLDAKSGKITPLLASPGVVYGFRLWLHDNSGFIYTANDESSSDFHIYKRDLATGKSTKLLALPGSWTAYDVTRDGSRLLVGQYISQSDASVHELTIATGELRKLNLGDGPTFNSAVGYTPDEAAALMISDVEDGVRRLFLRSLATGEVRKPMPSVDAFDVDSATMNPERTLLAVVTNEDGYGSLHVARLPGFAPVKLPPIEQGIVSSVDILGDTVSWILSNARTPGLAYAYDVGAAAARPLTTAEDQGIDLSAFTLPQLVKYESFDGLEIPAFLFLPPGHTRGQAIPFVVNFHGGPEGQHRPGFNAQTQYLLSQGFGVLMPNVRGSTGYGRAFHELDNYKNRWHSVKDGVEAARWLVREGHAKPGKIAAYGGSYGGFMAVATVIEGADVFGASVNIVGIVNFQTFLAQTRDYRRKLREAEYGPLSDPEFLASISPINRIDEIKVPMFIAHGLNDPRVPVGEAMQLAVGLQKRGYDPEQLYFPDEGHGFAKLENRLLFNERLIKFLKAHIAD